MTTADPDVSSLYVWSDWMGSKEKRVNPIILIRRTYFHKTHKERCAVHFSTADHLTRLSLHVYSSAPSGREILIKEETYFNDRVHSGYLLQWEVL